MSVLISKSRATAPLLALLMTSAAFAQEEGLPPIACEFPNGAVLTLYGQIDKGVLRYDDGAETESYGLIDNDNSSTRIGLQYEQTFGIWHFENVNEIGYAPFSSSNTNIIDQSPNSDAYQFSNDNIRKLDFSLESDRYGKIWAGQGSMATDGILEVDLSGTDLVAYSGVADSASGQLLRFSDGTLADIAIGDVFANLDGDRRVRLRYDTPTFANFTFAAAFGRNLLSDESEVRDQNLFDASLLYDNIFGDVEFQAGAGYNWNEADINSWGGSASALHRPTGLNLTLAAGTQDNDGDTNDFWYSKLGLLRGFVGWGDTAMSVDYYSGSGFGAVEGSELGDTSSDSWGLAVVQSIDRANTDLWLTWRSYDYSASNASFDDGTALFGGARFTF